MSDFKFDDLRCSSSSIDSYFDDIPVPRIASTRKVRISNMRELSGFQIVAEDKLIRLSQKDFWRLGKDEEGHFIERLVDDMDGPVKT